MNFQISYDHSIPHIGKRMIKKAIKVFISILQFHELFHDRSFNLSYTDWFIILDNKLI